MSLPTEQPSKKQTETSLDNLGEKLQAIRRSVGQYLVGQHKLVDRLLMALLCRGHLLLEGVPGVGKTLAVRLLAQTVDATFTRFQFTPDMQPADLIGTQILNNERYQFSFEKGPVFTNFLLADEINRAPAKVQSALLEAMQECQVSVGGQRYPLPEPFLVMATQNPIEMEGTYRLPEAQMDRFMFKIDVTYPSREEEDLIIQRMAHPKQECQLAAIVSLEDLQRYQGLLDSVHLSTPIKDYILDIVFATRPHWQEKEKHPNINDLHRQLAGLIEFGVSPRGTLHFVLAAKAHALLCGRDFVSCDDVRAVAGDVLRHRIRLTFEADAEGVDTEQVLDTILNSVAEP